jgi:hypothetical protein
VAQGRQSDWAVKGSFALATLCKTLNIVSQVEALVLSPFLLPDGPGDVCGGSGNKSRVS